MTHDDYYGPTTDGKLRKAWEEQRIPRHWGETQDGAWSGEDLRTEAELGGAGTSRIQPYEDALREGKIVGVTHDLQIVVDPRDYASGGDALQDVNNRLRDEGAEFGRVHFTPYDPDGNELVINDTVVFGDTEGPFAAVPRGWGFAGQYDAMLDCQINDGSPMFFLSSGSRLADSGTMQLNSTWFGGFAANAHGNDAEFIRLESVTAWTMERCFAFEFGGGTADGVYVLDGATYNSYVNRCNYVALSNDVSNAVVWKVQNTVGDATSDTHGPPGEIKWGLGNSTYADPEYPFKHVYHQTVDASSMVFGGRWEGNGDHKVRVDDGKLFIPGHFESGRNQSNDGSAIHDIYFAGTTLKVSPTADLEVNSTGGDIVHIADGEQLWLPEIQTNGMQDQTGDVIHFEKGGGGSNTYVVPDDRNFNGSVTYPPTPWSATRYHDGWKLFRQGTDTWSGGEEKLLNEYLRTGQEIKIDVQVNNEPAADVKWDRTIGYSSTTNEQAAWLTETVGAAGTDAIDVTWRIYAR